MVSTTQNKVIFFKCRQELKEKKNFELNQSWYGVVGGGQNLDLKVAETYFNNWISAGRPPSYQNPKCEGTYHVLGIDVCSSLDQQLASLRVAIGSAQMQRCPAVGVLKRGASQRNRLDIKSERFARSQQV